MFQRNLGSVGIATLIGLGGIALAFALSGGGGIPLIVAIGVLAVAALIAFAILVRALTPEGRKLLDEIAGLKLYLGVAGDELVHLQGPDAAAAARCRALPVLLPYAVALEVEEAWTRKFTLAVGAAVAATATAGMAWYRGVGGDNLSSPDQRNRRQPELQIRLASTPPGSSSGGGGGGFSRRRRRWRRRRRALSYRIALTRASAASAFPASENAITHYVDGFVRLRCRESGCRIPQDGACRWRR